MSKAVVKKEETAVVAQDNTGVSTQQVLASDIIVPNIYLMQPMSEAVVVHKKAQVGQFIRSTTMELVGDENNPFSIIPLKMVMHWINEELVGKKFEYRSRCDRNNSNSSLPWSFYRNPQGEESDKPFMGATEWRRVQAIGVYCLIKKDIDAYLAITKAAVESGEMPDLTKSLLPALITFRGVSFVAGKKLANYYTQYADMLQYNANLKSYGYHMELSCKQETNDKGTYYVMDLGAPKVLPKELIGQAARWYNYIQGTSDVKVDDSALDVETARVTEQSKF